MAANPFTEKMVDPVVYTPEIGSHAHRPAHGCDLDLKLILNLIHQIEGLAVDRDITFGDLKGVLEHFAHEFLGPETRVKFIPHFFPFTEPSAEVDIWWEDASQPGGGRWMEILRPGYERVRGAGAAQDQVRALERAMHDSLAEQGLNIDPRILVVTRLIPEAEGTTCDQRMEPIAGTRNAHILRVPFMDPAGHVVPQWISRFEIWPYLERFSHDVERELLAAGISKVTFSGLPEEELAIQIPMQQLEALGMDLGAVADRIGGPRKLHGVDPSLPR